MEIDIRQIFRAVIRFWWIIAFSVILFGGIAYNYASSKTPEYASRITLQVLPVQTGQTVDYNALMYAERLALTYQRIITVQPVMQMVIEELHLPYTPQELATHIQATAEADSQLLVVNVTDRDPNRAAAIANSLAKNFSAYLLQQNRSSNGVETSGPVVADSRITVADPAIPPTSPVSPKTMMTTAIGLATGLVLSLGLVLLIVYLDTTVKFDTNFEALHGGPLLSVLGRVARRDGSLFVADNPSGRAAEAVRLLRTNIEFASSVKEIRVLAVSSAKASEGKSTVAANLAASLANAGVVTAIVDANLRRPAQHAIFDAQNDRGLSTLLTKPATSWTDVAEQTHIENLVVIPAGPTPLSPADLLGSRQIATVLDELRETFDIVIVDTPPVLEVSDALAVGSHADAMMLVCRAGRTRIDAIRQTTAAIQQGHIRTAGIVVNQQKPGFWQRIRPGSGSRATVAPSPVGAPTQTVSMAMGASPAFITRLRPKKANPAAVTSDKLPVT